MSTNQRVKEIRLALNLSQAKFATAIAISNGYIAGIELGNRKVNDRLIKLICSTFNVNENWLKNGEGDMFKNPADTKFEMAMNVFKELNPDYQEFVLKQIDELLKIQNKK
ncbi:helix-turn-helix transcriptional regulator [Lysinibacillus louembei]|uniref:Helix-turn-helix transcriptional regulator n=1 Tax=Lysinibacillus louembei TaxID=1470088 RepID=A0ABZ0RRH8_9BACI|nr:helix-turn-helix transcriptional regulator [Lysinibacillus louembei]WPK10740.1 helix-turn-helix transcriptional regulator [Lysinibacillus louembei]